MSSIRRIALLAMFLACVLAGPVSGEEVSLGVGKLKWVRLIPTDPCAGYPAGHCTSNGCGTAEVLYETRDGEELTLDYEIGEWCETPYDERHDDQLFIFEGSRLLNFLPIKTDSDGKEFVVPRKNWELPITWEPLKKPYGINLYDEESYLMGESLYWDSSSLEVIDGRVFQAMGVFVESLLSEHAQ